MALDFFPFQEGQVLEASDLNELVEAIQDGTIFINTTFISSQLSTASSRLNGLEARVTLLESLQATLSMREQVELSAGQGAVNLSQVPILDTELLFLNGMSLAKSGIPIGYVGDYSLSGSTITFNTELSSQILAGDVLVVQYRYVS
jgi:hypothetical protein